MAVIIVRPTNGNDSNSGLTDALAKKTLAGAFAIYQPGDEIMLYGNEGDHALVADVSTAVSPIVMYTKAGHSKANITGSYRIICTSTSPSAKVKDIIFNNRGTNSVGLDLINGTNSIGFLAVDNCDLYTKIGLRASSTTNRISLNKSKFLYPLYANNQAESCFYSTATSFSNGTLDIKGCEFSGKILSGTTTLGNAFQNWVGNKFYFNSGNIPIRLAGFSDSFFFNFIWNTIVGCSSFIEYNSSTSFVANTLIFERNYIDCSGQIIANTGTGTLSLDSNGMSNNNILSTSTLTTGYNSTNDTTTSNPKFYLAGSYDFRIEIDSPLASHNGDTVGALVPEWDAFWDDHVASELKDGVHKRSRSRTPNVLGVLVEGESDGNKVLTTSTKIAGNYIPISSADYVKKDIPFGLSQTGNRTDANPINVKTGSGTYGANGTEFTPSFSPDYPERENVAPDDTVNGLSGTMDLPSLNKVAPTDTLRGQAGTMDLPSLSSIIPEDTLEGQAGTADIDLLANLPDETNVLILSGNFGKNLDKVPSYAPDFPNKNSVLTTDTTNGEQGTVVIPAENTVSDGTPYGPNNSLTGNANLLDLTKFTDLDPTKVEKNLPWKYNSTTPNRLGDAPENLPSTNPGEDYVLKDRPYMINGENFLGRYDNGKNYTYTSENSRIKILEEIEQTLYRINPATNPVYQSTVKSVSGVSGETHGLIDDDMPHVQVVADDSQYDHRYVLSGNRPFVKLDVKLKVTTPSNWSQLECEILYEDIRQAFIRDNFNLNGLVNTTEISYIRIIKSESQKVDDQKQSEIGITLKYIELINE